MIKYGNRISTPLLMFFLAVFYAMTNPHGLFAADKDAFSIARLGVADRILDLHVEDLDGDRLKDIIITHVKGLPPKETRWISIFHQSADGGYSSAANQSWEIDTLAVLLDTGDVAGDMKKEIVIVMPDRVSYYGMAEQDFKSRPEALFEVKGITVFPAEGSIPLLDFVRDWDGDGTDEIAIFKFEGIEIYGRDSTDAYKRTNAVYIPLRTSMGGSINKEYSFRTEGLNASFRFPDMNLIDFDSDGRRDLIITRQDRLAVYKMGRDGLFTEKPLTRMDFDVRTKKEKIERNAFTATTIQDLNSDGYADAIVTKQTSKGLSNFRGVLNIYPGGDSGFNLTPNQVIISEGTASTSTIIRDVNGDGMLDLILPSIKISITAIIRFLISRSIPINFNIFLLRPDGMFSERPDFSKEVKLKIDFSGESDTQAMDLRGDYNGDGRRDFVFATDEDRLSVYLGIAGDDDRLFSKNSVAEIETDAFGELESYDLNNDGFSDMIINYPENDDMEGIVTVLMNRGRIK